MLAVVEYQQCATPAEILEQTLDVRRAVTSAGQLERAHDRRDNVVVVINFCKPDRPDLGVMRVEPRARELERESRLADTARTDERDEAMLGELKVKCFKVRVAPDESSERRTDVRLRPLQADFFAQDRRLECPELCRWLESELFAQHTPRVLVGA